MSLIFVGKLGAKRVGMGGRGEGNLFPLGGSTRGQPVS